MDSHAVLDDLDLRVLHALQIDARAPFSRIGEVLGVSDQTVARRYARLRAEAGLRATGLTHPSAVGEEEWLIRLRCVPGSGAALAAALVRHPEPKWVHLTSGSTEIVCTTRSVSGQDLVLLSELPRSRQVTAISAHCVLYTFFGGERTLLTKTGALTDDQIAALRPEPAPTDPAPAALTGGDRALVAELARDARATFAVLAKAAGVSQSAAQRRVAELRRAGVLYFRLDIDFRHLGRATHAVLWLSVAPGSLVEVGEALARHPQVAFAASTTGSTNLYAVVLVESTRALHEYLTGPVAALPGIGGVETAPVVRAVKRAGLPATR